MTTINRFGAGLVSIAVVLSTVLISPNLAYAKSTPLAEGTGNFATADTQERRAITDRNWTLPSNCNDKQAKILFKAGFNRPGMLRGAWAITWRESKHESLDESSRYFTGALGTWQSMVIHLRMTPGMKMQECIILYGDLD